jgi:hypothetical protein
MDDYTFMCFAIPHKANEPIAPNSRVLRHFGSGIPSE